MTNLGSNAVEVWAEDDYNYPFRQDSSTEAEDDEQNASGRGRSTKRTFKWVVVFFLVLAAVVPLVPLWQIAFHKPNKATLSAATTSDTSIDQDSTKTGVGEKDQGDGPSPLPPSISPLASMAPSAIAPLTPVAPNPDGSFPFVFPNTDCKPSSGKGGGSARSPPCPASSTGIVQINQGETDKIGSFLAELVQAVGPSLSDTTIAGFPSGTVTIDGQAVSGSSVTISSLEVLETLEITPSSANDFTIRINRRLSVPVMVLPVASKPRVEAPPAIVVDCLEFQVHRTDPNEILSVELHVGTDAAGNILGDIKVTEDVPGIVLSNPKETVYRIESTPSILSSPEFVELGINLLLGGNLCFLPNAQAKSGSYSEGIQVIVTSTDTDNEAQIATAATGIYLPVMIGSAAPSPAMSLSTSMVEDVPKQIGNDFVRFVSTQLPTSDGPFRLSGFPLDTMLSYVRRGKVVHATVRTFGEVIVLFDIDELRSLVATAPPQSDENFRVLLVDERSEATLDISVIVLAVADKPTLLATTPNIESIGGASVPVRVFPAVGDDIDGSECLSVLFEVGFDSSTQQTIGNLSFNPNIPLSNVKFAELGAGRYEVKASSGNLVLDASFLRLLFGNGAVVFSPAPGISGIFTDGLIIRVQSREQGDVAPSNNTDAGTKGDLDTSTESLTIPVKVTIFENASETVAPSPNIRTLTSESPSSYPMSEPTTGMPMKSPTSNPTTIVTLIPTATVELTDGPTITLSALPTASPIAGNPTDTPTTTSKTTEPTVAKTQLPTRRPTETPTKLTRSPSSAPVVTTSKSPSNNPTATPTMTITESPTTIPTDAPSKTKTAAPTAAATMSPTKQPTGAPTNTNTESPSTSPTVAPTKTKTAEPTSEPTKSPSKTPTSTPTTITNSPTITPTLAPTKTKTAEPTGSATKSPNKQPSVAPTNTITDSPTTGPTVAPTKTKTAEPTAGPTKSPSKTPTSTPTNTITNSPTINPTAAPTKAATDEPTVTATPEPTISPTAAPTKAATGEPTVTATPEPTISPTSAPTIARTDTPTVTANPVGGQWLVTEADADLTNRHEACFVMIGDVAILAGGRFRGNNNVDIYDPTTRTWREGNAPPRELHHMQCVEVDGKLWIVSAWTGNYPTEDNAGDIFIYDPATDSWSTKPGLPEARQRGSTAVVLVESLRRIYVSHGNRGGHETGDHAVTLGWLDFFDIDNDVWVTGLPDAPNPRDHTGGALVNGDKICISGGRDSGELDFFANLVFPTDCYDLNTNTWSVEADIPVGGAGGSYGTTCDGKLMIAGGEVPGRALSDVFVFDGTTWTTMPSLNIARHGSGLAVNCRCNQIYIASGSGSQGGSPELGSVETFFPGGADVPCPAP